VHATSPLNPLVTQVDEWGLMRVCKRYTHKILWHIFGFFPKHNTCTRQMGKTCAQLNWLYHSKNVATNIQANHVVKRHLDYKYIPTLIFHPTHHNDTTCLPWCLVQSVLTRNVRLQSTTSHLYLAKRLPFIELHGHFLFFFFCFSPYAPSPMWVVLGLWGLKLSEKQLSTHLGLFPY